MLPLQRRDLVHKYAFPDIYNHRKDGFISDEIVIYADESTKEINA